MKRSIITRSVAGAGAASVAAAAALIGSPALAASQPIFSYSQGWRVETHVRELADVNGDGREDVVGFGGAGVYVSHARADGTFTPPVLRVRGFGQDQGWSNARHVRTVADVDGDGRGDVVGFGGAGVWVSYAQPDGSFTAPALKVRNFGEAQGWRVDRHPRHLADLDGDGTADIVGFGHSGVTISHGMADRTFLGTGKRIDGFGYDRGWRMEKHPRMLADVDGNGTADIVGFADNGVYVSYFSEPGDTFTREVREIAGYGYAQGWRVDRHPRAVADANGDGRADVIGFAQRGTYASYSRSFDAGEPKFQPASLELEAFGAQQGWQVGRHPRTMADVNGDGIADVVGFASDGAYVSSGDDNFLTPPERITSQFGYDGGWVPGRYPRLLGDVNGDGRDDIVGFGHSVTTVRLS